MEAGDALTGAFPAALEPLSPLHESGTSGPDASIALALLGETTAGGRLLAGSIGAGASAQLQGLHHPQDSEDSEGGRQVSQQGSRGAPGARPPGARRAP